ncbi:hypothetical protein BIW11_11401 [Tropilaelaps mercedesae]|uniref:Protein kinase domain-containing protein n=1 Tax=Tropilaelaps mercedesae TaxID=418985 RepID=A0A1V9XB70_9ACAR|nr:hypothetical protein BIW11_11401 [Tropilaelaps mercedesae]
MAVEELNCLAQALAVASMATSELQRFDLNVVLKKEPEARPKTCPVYDRVQQTVRYSQVRETCRIHLVTNLIAANFMRFRGDPVVCCGWLCREFVLATMQPTPESLHHESPKLNLVDEQRQPPDVDQPASACRVNIMSSAHSEHRICCYAKAFWCAESYQGVQRDMGGCRVDEWTTQDELALNFWVGVYPLNGAGPEQQEQKPQSMRGQARRLQWSRHRRQLTLQTTPVLNNDQLDSLLSCEKDMRDIMGVARSRHVVCLDETRSAVIFGEDRDHLQTVVSRLVPRTLPSGRVRSYLAQMCAICSDLHERGFTLQGALQLSAFALDRCNHVFLLSSGGVQRANCWRPVAINPQYAAPEIIARTTQRQQRKLSTCSNCDSLFIADAYSVGICGLIMATGKRPFPVNVTRSFTAQDFLQQASNLVPEIPDDLDKDLRCLLFHLLERSPKRRIRVSDALHHPALHAFVGHLRRSPPVSTPGALSCMHTTSNNNNNNSDDLDGGRQVERRRTVDVEDSSNTEVILQKIDNTATSDHLNLNGAAMPASPEGSDQGDACDANEGLGDLECRGDASLADGSALVEFVHAIGAVSNALSDNNGNSSNNIDSSNNISQHLKSYEALSATVHQVSRVQAKGDDAAAAAAAAAALSNKVPSQECLPAERPESADKKRRHRKVVADVESPLSLLEFSAGRAEDSEPEDDDDGGVGGRILGAPSVALFSAPLRNVLPSTDRLVGSDELDGTETGDPSTQHSDY